MYPFQYLNFVPEEFMLRSLGAKGIISQEEGTDSFTLAIQLSRFCLLHSRRSDCSFYF